MEGRGGLNEAGRKSLGDEESQWWGAGGTLLFGLYGDVLPDKVWFFGHAVLNRVCNFTCFCPKLEQNLS